MLRIIMFAYQNPPDFEDHLQSSRLEISDFKPIKNALIPSLHSPGDGSLMPPPFVIKGLRAYAKQEEIAGHFSRIHRKSSLVSSLDHCSNHNHQDTILLLVRYVEIRGEMAVFMFQDAWHGPLQGNASEFVITPGWPGDRRFFLQLRADHQRLPHRVSIDERNELSRIVAGSQAARRLTFRPLQTSAPAGWSITGGFRHCRA